MKRVGRSALPLPRYTLRKRLKGGVFGYFFNIPMWARKRGCSIENEALGTDYSRAVTRAEQILLPAFDSWRTGGEDAKPTHTGVVVGTLDWMFHLYRQTWSQPTAKRLQPLSPGQCRVHETGIKMICEYILQDGRRLGVRRVSSIDTAFVDDLFAKLLFRDVNGKKVERRTTVNHAMKTARSAWNTISRAHPGAFPPKNPFERMGLQSTSRETPHATFAELVAFRAKAIEMGYSSLATGALIGWELLQREAHIFIRFMVDHYRPPSRPDHVYVINYKTSTGSWEPLLNSKGAPLYPVLMAELDAIKQLRPTGGLMMRRDGSSLPWFGKAEMLTQVQRITKKIILAAGLRPELTFTSFGRHGGTTEASASGLTETQLMQKGQWSSTAAMAHYLHDDDEAKQDAQMKRIKRRARQAKGK
ncbi:hypothetical protein [Bradyrhizobium sp. CER78]|uniref:hypothetical protein n=1 Tax=Bradyrhizobium sp. CER78 TaxID=3039162 RepID=UPI00244D068D|nr:hypothetical protein [Bradyrhizobium sp. CER78]MDH2385470.1 hypothetical protein [Bradyrhizobium sp. CER78]